MLTDPWMVVMKVIVASPESDALDGVTAAGLSGKQHHTVRQLERERVCAAGVVEVLEDCGWIQISDASRQLQVTVDRDGSVLAREGPGRRAKRLRTQ